MTTIEDLRSRATVSVPEAGEVLGIGRGAAYNAARRGELPTIKLGGRVLVPTQALLDMLATAASGAR